MSNPCSMGSGSGSGSGHGHGHGRGSGSGSGSGHCSGSGSGSGASCNVYCVNNSCGVYATNTCGPCPTVTFNETIVPGSGAGCYTIIRTWTAADSLGNSVSQSQTITVYDNVRPSINCPNNITVCVQQAAVTFNVPASDNCGTPTVTTSHASGSTFPMGNTYVTATADDGCGNTRSCTFRIRVRSGGCGNHKTGEGSEAEGDDDMMSELSLRAFPNPTNGKLDLQLTCNDCDGTNGYVVKVADMYGRTLIDKNVEATGGETALQLDLSDFAAGTYMIIVEDGAHRLMERIIKE